MFLHRTPQRHSQPIANRRTSDMIDAMLSLDPVQSDLKRSYDHVHEPETVGTVALFKHPSLDLQTAS